MNNKELVSAIAADIGQPVSRVANVLASLGKVAQQQLVSPGAELTMPGIGKLKAVHKEARTGRNPKTGADLAIPAKTAVKFTAAKALKDAVA